MASLSGTCLCLAFQASVDLPRIRNNPINRQDSAYVLWMTDTFEWRKARLAMFARDAVDARSDHRKDTDAVIDRTAKLRTERLEREAVIPLPAPVQLRKSSQKAKSARR